MTKLNFQYTDIIIDWLYASNNAENSVTHEIGAINSDFRKTLNRWKKLISVLTKIYVFLYWYRFVYYVMIFRNNRSQTYDGFTFCPKFDHIS